MAKYHKVDNQYPSIKRQYSYPVEEHSTAAWANMEKFKPVSQVQIPSDLDVEFAREWIEENKK